ncbi:MAG TPA: DUF1559 domain-containing protein, partial [Isosphaeraceae bacterium]
MRRLIRDPRLRAGFTLIELLVVIAIIGVLVALIMPAVQAAREAARRTQCLNNLRQLGVGSHQYHDSFSSLPSGWFCEPYTTGCSNQGATDYQWSGLTSLLLQVEQEALYGEINFEVQPYTPENRTVISRTLAAFVCPSNRKP